MTLPSELIDDAVSVVQREFVDDAQEDNWLGRKAAARLEGIFGTVDTLRILRGAGFHRNGLKCWETRLGPRDAGLTELKLPYGELIALRDQWLGRQTLAA